MILPDSQIIAEALLFVNGFKNSRPLSAKLVKVFKFAETQLGSSEHYDFGLRTLKGVLDQAGQLKQLVLGVVDPTKVEREQAEDAIEKHLEIVKSMHQKSEAGIRQSEMDLINKNKGKFRSKTVALPEPRRGSFMGYKISSEAIDKTKETLAKVEKIVEEDQEE